MPYPRALSACLLIALTSIGCAEPVPEFGQVSGVVKARGKPLMNAVVTYMPDPSQGNNWPINAIATTNDDGQYELKYAYKGEEGVGAPVGWHVVTVVDTRYSSIPQGQPLPPRLFPLAYSNPTTTPLKIEVKPGEQTIDLNLDSL
ncbi:MAG TPA: hypothetical protein VF175_01540 [Lacipirellula sp.]